MKELYKQVKADAEALRFLVACEICGKKIYGEKIPLFCRGARTLARCKIGKANKLSQRAFNRAKANSTQLIALSFNQCRRCYRWVCDGCFDCTDPDGVCKTCSEKNDNTGEGGLPNG